MWALTGLVAGCGGGDPPATAAAATACTGAEACVSTIASGPPSTDADADAESTVARFWFPYAVAPDDQGNVYVADYGNHQVPLRIDSSGQVEMAAGEVTFAYPSRVATAGDGTRYVADTFRNRILKVAPDGTTAVVAGTGRPGDEDGVATAASFKVPHGVALDAQGNLYVADSGNARVRKITFP